MCSAPRAAGSRPTVKIDFLTSALKKHYYTLYLTRPGPSNKK